MRTVWAKDHCKGQGETQFGSPSYPPRLLFFCGTVCVLGSLLIFVLPLFIPGKPVPTESASYNAGFNNSVAVASSVLLSVAAFFWTWSVTRGGAAIRLPPAEEGRLTPRFLMGVLVASGLALSLAGWLVEASHLRYLADAGYIIEQATVRRETGRALYTQLEFAYGPLLLLPEVWLSELLRCRVTTAYYIALVVESTLGLLMLAYVLNELPIRGSLRRWAMGLLAFGAITPHLGLNYTFFRFASPYALLLFATRRSQQAWQCALWLTLGELLEVAISPELGLALAAGAVVFALLRAWEAGFESGWTWLLAAVLPVGTLAAFLATQGRSYLEMAASFSRGALNLPVGPYPHLLVYLFALLWLVPVGLALSFRPGLPGSARILAVYAVGLAFIPPTLGRCDPLHVMFDGVGVIALSLIWVSLGSPRARLAWVAALLVMVLWNSRVNNRLFADRNANVLRDTVMPQLSPGLRRLTVDVLAWRRGEIATIFSKPPGTGDRVDMAALNARTGTAKVATPIDLPPAVEDQLIQAGKYAPGYYAYWVDMMNPAAEQRSINEVDACPWMLVPGWWKPETFHTIHSLSLFQGMRMPYRWRNEPLYAPGVAFQRNLLQNWQWAGRLGDYILFRNQSLTGADGSVGSDAACGSTR